MTKEALTLALEALEGFYEYGYDRRECFENITAIKEALAQPEPWEKFCDSNCVWTDHHPDCKLAEQAPVAWMDKYGEIYKSVEQVLLTDTPLYTSSPVKEFVCSTGLCHYRKPLTKDQ